MRKKQKIILVIAGNYKQYQLWLFNNRGIEGIENSRYISSAGELYGYHPEEVEIILTGEYWKSSAHNSDRFQYLSKK